VIELSNALTRAIEVAAGPDACYALVADVPDSAAHFPQLEELVPEGGGYTWRLEKVGAGKLSLQAIYGSRYDMDPEARRVAWSPIEGVGNARVSGAWTITPQGDGARLDFTNSFTLTVNLPRLLRRPAQALVERENSRLVDAYLANLKETLDGGDGRVR